MTHTTWTIIRRSGLPVLPLAVALWAAMPVYPEATGTADLTTIRAHAEQGSILDEILLAGDYFTGTGVEKDPKMAAYWYEKAAGHGSPEAQNQIGYFYQAGIGVSKDPKRAAHWYQLAAASGFPKAKVNLAVAYLRGIGVQQENELAVRLFNQAFQAGNGTAATYLGLLYYFGIAVKQDKEAAEKWFEAGLKLHDPLAAYDLGSMYSINPDHAHDLRKAASLLRQAADGGYVPAMHSLGLLLVNHPEVKQANPQECRMLLETAANAGSWKSSIVLGILARDGRGTPVDYKTAYYHFRVALLQGGADAEKVIKKDVEIMAARISAEDGQTALSAANTWFEHHSLSLIYVYREGSPRRDFPMTGIALAPDGSAGQLLPPSGS
ncbi:MAG: sel1 repeat family protein [Edaphobacter sp.]|nr:sel1 repeat family protein [Edaphobacter sp.]